MLLQQVTSKVIVEVSPDGVDMVRIVLSVVILEQERWSMNPVVMALTALSGACPSKADLAATRGVYFGEVGDCEVTAKAAHVFFDNAPKEFLLSGVHLVESQTLGLAHISRSIGHGQDVIGSIGLNERMLLLPGVQGGHQFASHVFLSSQDPESGSRTLADFSRVGAHERRCSAGKLALRESEVE